MEKRVLLAVSLSFVVLFVYQALFVKPKPPQAQSPLTTASPSSTPGAAPSAPASAVSTPPAIEGPVEASLPVASAGPEQDVTVETDLVIAVFGTRGAEVKSWKLKHFPEKNGQEVVDLAPPPFDGPPPPRPFALRFETPEVTALVRRALFKPSTMRLDATSGPGALAFDFADASGLKVRKEFLFEPRSYVVRVSVSASNAGGQTLNPVIEWGPGLGDYARAVESNSYTQAPEGILFHDGSTVRLKPNDIDKQPHYDGVIKWGGVDDHYFLAAAVPVSKNVSVDFSHRPAPLQPGEKAARVLVAYSVKYPQPPSQEPFFIGPKDFDALASVDRDFVRVINFGIFKPIVVPLLQSLKWVNGYVGNYGWSIIVLTILINAVMFPLRHKSVVSMRKLQMLQPEIKAIQDRYAKLSSTDPARQKMNTELMTLYRERGVNPASGCVPIILTMPVLFAFYSMLSQAIELRGAPFIGWITDLSARDPLFITPVLMGATMVVQQIMTPSAGDPAQQKMMMIMPVVFTLGFLWSPSGLVIYWLMSNLWAIAQQGVTNKLIGAPKLAKS